MKYLLTYLLITVYWAVWSQGQISYLYEALPTDSISPKSIDDHTSILPKIRQSRVINSSKNDSTKNSFEIGGLIDGALGFRNNTWGKAGLGFHISSELNKKWFFRFMALQSIGSSDSNFMPKSAFQYADKSNDYFTDLRARVGYTPNSFFHFQVGLDQHFIGEGSRSLFLSDYGKPFPYGQIRVKFWRVEYMVLYQFLGEKINSQFQHKNATTHYVSFNATKWLNIGVFESVVFQPKDTLFNRGYEVEYLNPVILFRPQEYGLGSSDNVLLGISIAAKYRKNTFYTQLLLDEFLLKEIRSRSKWWANKYGVQLGWKNYHQFEKVKSFHRIEMNLVRPYTYAHISGAQNYGHLHHPLAHPYGSSFTELALESKWTWKKFTFKLFANYFLQGGSKDSLNYGNNIYASYVNWPSEFGNKIGQGAGFNGVKTYISAAWNVFPYQRWQIFLENHLMFTTLSKNLTYMPVIGIRSQLWNDYRNY